MIDETTPVTVNVNEKLVGSYHNEISELYGSNDVYFAWAIVRENNVAESVSAFVTCRDLFINQIRQKYLNTELNPNRTELIISSPTKDDEDKNVYCRVIRSITLLNAIEKTNRWRRTKIYKVSAVNKIVDGQIIPAYKPEDFILIVGSKIWRDNVFFAYMYSHILRSFARDTQGHLDNVETWEDLIAGVADRGRSRNQALKSSWNTYVDRMDLWPLVWKHRRRIFKGYKLTTLYKRTKDEYCFDGIYKLTLGQSFIEVLNERFRNVIDEEKQKTQEAENEK